MAKVNNTAAPVAATNYAATGVGPTMLTAASVKRNYGKPLSAAFAARTFTLTALGQAAATAQGATGMAGQQTAMGLTAWAVSVAANGGTSATGAAIVNAMLAHTPLIAALAKTKAFGTHFNANSAPSPAFCAGYVNGLCLSKHGLAK